MNDRIQNPQPTETDIQDQDYLSMRAAIADEVEKGEDSDAAERAVEEISTEDAPVVEERHVETEDDAGAGDEWEGVPKKIRETFESIQTMVEDLKPIPGRLKQAESRLGAMQNEFYAAKKAAEDIKKAPTKEQMKDAAESSEEWDRLKGDFPEWAEAIDGRIAAMTGGANVVEVQALKDEIKSLKADAGSVDQPTLNRMIAEAILDFAHPGYKKTIESKEFDAWLEKQDKEFIAKTSSTDFNQALEVLDAYAEATSKPKEKTASEIAASRSKRLRQSVSIKGKKADSPKAESDMNEQEFRQKAAREAWADD